MTDNDPIQEAPNSTVDDWLGQEVNRDQELADEVVKESGGDLAEAERRFNERSAINDPEAVKSVPPEVRPS